MLLSILWRDRHDSHLLKTPLIITLGLKNELGDPHFLLSNCDNLYKMQLFEKFKKILECGFKATLFSTI